MDERNLAIVFSPAFLRARVETPEIIIGDAPHTTGLIATVIDGVEFYLGIKTPRTIDSQPKSAPLTDSVCKVSHGPLCYGRFGDCRLTKV